MVGDSWPKVGFGNAPAKTRGGWSGRVRRPSVQTNGAQALHQGVQQLPFNREGVPPGGGGSGMLRKAKPKSFPGNSGRSISMAAHNTAQGRQHRKSINGFLSRLPMPMHVRSVQSERPDNSSERPCCEREGGHGVVWQCEIRQSKVSFQHRGSVRCIAPACEQPEPTHCIGMHRICKDC